MIHHEEADRIYNLYADLESSFLDLVCLIGSDSSQNRSCIDRPLHLIWQHIEMLNKQLYSLLKELTDEESQRAQAMGGASPHAAPMTLGHNSA